MFRGRNHSLHSHLHNIFKVKDYDTLLFHRIIIITQCNLFCLSSSWPQLWNNLTTYLRIKNNIYTFSTNYKKVLIHFNDDN